MKIKKSTMVVSVICADALFSVLTDCKFNLEMINVTLLFLGFLILSKMEEND